MKYTVVKPQQMIPLEFQNEAPEVPCKSNKYFKVTRSPLTGYTFTDRKGNKINLGRLKVRAYEFQDKVGWPNYVKLWDFNNRAYLYQYEKGFKPGTERGCECMGDDDDLKMFEDGSYSVNGGIRPEDHYDNGATVRTILKTVMWLSVPATAITMAVYSLMGGFNQQAAEPEYDGSQVATYVKKTVEGDNVVAHFDTDKNPATTEFVGDIDTAATAEKLRDSVGKNDTLDSWEKQGVMNIRPYSSER